LVARNYKNGKKVSGYVRKVGVKEKLWNKHQMDLEGSIRS
jgi:hypothetical protein